MLQVAATQGQLPKLLPNAQSHVPLATPELQLLHAALMEVISRSLAAL
jgi:hypothetical protein